MSLALKFTGILVLSVLSATLQASSFGFSTTGTDSAGNPLAASAVFNILDSHHFTITLHNDQHAIQEITQVLEGLDFSVAVTGLVLVSVSGDLLMISSDGSVNVIGKSTSAWEFRLAGLGAEWVLFATCGGGDGAPIIGDAPYPSSLTGTYFDGPVTFEFTTDSSLPTDGTDPFSEVFFLFGSKSRLPALHTGNDAGFQVTGSQGPVGGGNDPPDVFYGGGTTGGAIGNPYSDTTEGSTGNPGSGTTGGPTGNPGGGTTGGSTGNPDGDTTGISPGRSTGINTNTSGGFGTDGSEDFGPGSGSNVPEPSTWLICAGMLLAFGLLNRTEVG
jgi:hypothetical protein